MVYIQKKDGTKEPWDSSKVVNAVRKSAERVMKEISDEDGQLIVRDVIGEITKQYDVCDTDVVVPVETMHHACEAALDNYDVEIAKSYRNYRNYKTDFVHILDDVYKKAQSIRYLGDRDNANTDSSLVPTQRSLIYNELNSELYKKFFLNVEERQAMKDGYIYIHDRSARLDTMNCFRRDTRFITKDGVKSFYDFYDGDETVVMSHRGIWRKAVVHKYGWQPIQKVTFKKGTPTSNQYDVYCTKDHRWILKDSSETTNLSVGDILYQVPDVTKFDWNTLSLEDKKLWCRGFAKGDGSLIGSSAQNRPTYVIIRLCGRKTEYADRFRDCGYTVSDMYNDTNDLIVHMFDTNTKDIPFLSLNYSNVLYYINGLMCADGHRTLSENASSEFRGIQVTGEMNRYIYDLLNMSGYFVSSKQDLTGTETNYGVREKETIKYQVSSTQNRTSAWRVSDIQPDKLNPKAEVWCLEVEEDHSFLLEYGIPTGNCCLFDISNVMSGGFEMGNVWYNEPKSLDVAFDVMSDIAITAAAAQYGGFTMARVDTILSPYAEKSYQKYYREYMDIVDDIYEITNKYFNEKADEYAESKVRRDFEQGFQSWEYRFNTVGSSRGDYPFVAISFGVDTSRWGQMATEVCLEVRKEGQGQKGFKKPVLFPKLTFLYDKSLHGEGMPLEYLFDDAIECSKKCMYPDFLSLTGDGYIPSMYKKYGEVVSLMGK